MTHISPVKQRLRFTFGKFGALKYISHLEVAKLWERVLRRANAPILYSEGFNARPRFHLASPLPLGMTSECEIAEVMLREVLPTLDGLVERLESVSPAGLKVYSIVPVSIQSPALQTLVRSAEYRVTFMDSLRRDDLQARIDAILTADSIIRRKTDKKGRTHIQDLKPLIYALTLESDNCRGEACLAFRAHVAAGAQNNLRLSDLLEEMGLAEYHWQAHRLRLGLEEIS